VPRDLAYDIAHELGHAFDLGRNDSARRRQWRRLRGIDVNLPWFGCNRCSDYDTPAGDFAETFAFLLLGPGNYRSKLGQPPNELQAEELARFCEIDLSATAAAPTL
jgi:hypothetical protein